MHSVKIDKTKLLVIVRENRAKHDTAHNEAKEGYGEKLVAKLKLLLREAKAGKKIGQNIGLVEPICNLADYDRVIRMLELSTDDIVELDSHSFEQYVLDKWQWSGQFAATNALYSKTGR